MVICFSRPNVCSWSSLARLWLPPTAGAAPDPNGNNQECADCISVFLDHVSPAEDVNAEFQFDLLDGGGRIVPSYSRTTKHTFAKHELNWGSLWFIKREELEKSDHLKNDRFTIRCDVTVLKELLVKELVESSFVEVPPSNMHRRRRPDAEAWWPGAG